MFTREKAARRILLLEFAGFFVVAAAVWLDELFDMPHLLFDAPRSNFNLHEAAFESFAILLLGIAVATVTWRLTRRISELEEMLPICSFCKKIRRFDADPEQQESWQTIEHFIHERTGTRFSHSLCPECLEKHYGEILHDKR
jgi:hypothetical protein